MKFLSSLVIQGSGVMGNLVVEKNGVIRQRNVPANPNSSAQQFSRSTLASFAALWSSTLTPTQRAGWNEYATTVLRNDALGKQKKLSGIDMYVSANAALAVAVQSPVSARPSDDGALSLPPVVSAVLDDSANTLLLTFGGAIPAGTFVNLFVSPTSISLGRSKYSGPYRSQDSQEGSGASALTFAGLTAPVTGEQWGWRIRAVNAAGQVSVEQTGLVIVTA